MSAKISWTRDWPVQDYTGFTTKQLNNAKRIYKKLAILLINAQIKKLGKRITYKLIWGHDKETKTQYTLYAYLNPAAIEVPRKKKNPSHGGQRSNVSPTPPTQP